MKKLAFNLILGISLIAVPSSLFIYWYSHNHEVFIKSFDIIRSDASATRILGENIEASPIVHLRVSEKHGGADASYKVYGTRATAEAKVSARLDGEAWRFNWIWLKLENGRYLTLVDNRKQQQH